MRSTECSDGARTAAFTIPIRFFRRIWSWHRKRSPLRKRPTLSSPNILLVDALKNAVSAFDGFGRAISAERGHETRFQNLSGARRNIQDKFGFDFADELSDSEWKLISMVFQKRHLLTHKMGVIDDDYVLKADDPDAVAGRKVQVHREDVEEALAIVRKLGDRLYEGMFSQP